MIGCGAGLVGASCLMGAGAAATGAGFREGPVLRNIVTTRNNVQARYTRSVLAESSMIR